ncbi:hypothetical protein SAMN05421664_2231 [Chryseobacterium soldanellicola]|uniref:Uncharacterized protein n=1 Tax=Chryseobacterium soldanellicola TaxID=311333 RepID=A0A1H1D1A3_9FLAO|nr:hypothetical protein [Chryseobacterium soldanellicola]SDQ70039.1 hypothetical protein SAMN05421664_2231 [Chryseobacterium soldanellicola]
MKKRIVLFSLVVFFTTLCVGLFAHKGNTHFSPDLSSKSKLLQKPDCDSQPEMYILSDVQDNADSDDLEKEKFDFSLILKEHISYFVTDYSFKIQSVTIPDSNHIAVPRYILYHSLQVSDH